MSQFEPGVVVRIKSTGQLFRVDCVLPNGRLWLVNPSLAISVAAADVETAAAPKNEPGSKKPKR